MTPASGSWPADPLLACLLCVARAHGVALTAESATAGLPLVDHRLTPALFARAAARADLACNLVHRPVVDLDHLLFPSILLLRDDSACVLLGWSEGGEAARVILPDLGESVVEMPRTTLEARYTGYAFVVRPRMRFDARAPEVAKVRERHWFWSALLQHLPLYRDVMVAAFFINVFAVALPLFTMNVYDRVVPNQALETLWVLAAGVMIVVVGDLVLRTIRAYYLDIASSRVDVTLSSFIMERVLGMRLEYKPASAGSFAANLRAFESVRDFITSATVTAFIDLPFALLFILLIAWIAGALVIPLLVGIVLILLFGWVVQGRMQAISESSYRAGAQRNATLIESLVGLETLKAFAAEGRMQRKWESSVAFLAKAGSQLRMLASSAMHWAQWVQQSVSVAVLVLGVYLIMAGELSLGGLIACSMLASRALAPISQVAGLLTQYRNAVVALRSVNEIVAQPVERLPNQHFLTRPRLRGDIEFRDVSFNYPGQDVPALRGVTLRLRAGEHVAILGRMGSGKSTLQKLMLGLYQPVSGAVMVDGIDIRQMDPAELRRQVGYVPQDVSLFYGSLRDNITLAAPQADDERVLEAARIAGIDEFVNAHPQGFDLLVGERGESLSGGQRHAVAIARAVINHGPILLLDEPTGAMDHSSEEGVKQRLRSYAEGKTLVVVTHRTSLLDLVERIIVVDGGRIVADGPKDQVVEALRHGRIGRAG